MFAIARNIATGACYGSPLVAVLDSDTRSEVTLVKPTDPARGP